MLSVIIATDESERLLVPTLAALVQGAMASILQEVLVADAGSHDSTAKIADAAGCRFLVTPAPLGARLKAAAALARAPWLLFLKPGVVPDLTWIDDTSRFMRETELGRNADTKAAVFRPISAAGSRRAIMAEALTLMAAALGARPRADQGLLISAKFYAHLGGHRPDGTDPESDLLRRLGRRRIVMLRSGAVMAVE